MDFFALIIGYLITGLIFGFITQHVAQSKGYEGGFGWGFWLGFIGLLVVGFRANKPKEETSIAIPDNYQGKAKVNPAGGAISLQEEPNGNVITWIPSNSDLFICGINPNAGWAKIRFNNQEGYVKIEDLKYETKDLSPVTKMDTAKASNNSMDFAEMLEKLAKLHDQGILTDEEYQQKKTDILARM